MASLTDPAEITPATHAYIEAMEQATTPSAPVTAPAPMAEPKLESEDTPMSDLAAISANNATVTGAPSPVPMRNGTPSRLNGTESNSRSTSLHPESTLSIPSEAPIHGAPVRQYLNSKVTASVLDGMKQLARDQPKDPLRVLGEYLLQRSRELEGN